MCFTATATTHSQPCQWAVLYSIPSPAIPRNLAPVERLAVISHSYTTIANDSKHNEASFSMTSTDMLYLCVTQMPRSPDLAFCADGR